MADSNLILIKEMTRAIRLSFLRIRIFPKTEVRMDRDTFSQNLFAMELSKDLTIVAGNGRELKCHKLIFGAHSEVLGAMVPPKTDRIEMRENSEAGLKLLIRYLYGFPFLNDGVPCDVAVELLKTAHHCQLLELQVHLEYLLVDEKELEWYTPDDVLEAYFYTKDLEGFEELCKSLVGIMAKIPEKIRACKLYKELDRDDVDHLVWKLFDLVKGEITANDWEKK